MAGKYFVCADQDLGGAWTFTGEQLARVAAEARPGATVSGPYGEDDFFEIKIPGGSGWKHEVLYQARNMAFSFREEDEIDLTAGLVFQILQRLAPDVPASWVADFEGAIHPLRVADRTEDDFVSELESI